MHRKLIILIGISIIIRVFLAWYLDFGNDEVYYWIYAKYPDWSHFDHPPMVGWFIQLFSLNLLLESELFIRISSVITGALNTLIIYKIASDIKDEKAGFYAAVLYNTSIYAFLIAGTFIMPDTPLLFFWLLSLFLIIRYINSGSNLYIYLASIAIGLGMLSKYTAVFLWIGIYLYVIFYDRKFLKNAAIYIAPFLSLMVFLPVIIWNIKNDFISFTFQGGRVSFLANGINLNYFFRELLGGICYNNPIITLTIIYKLLSLFKLKNILDKNLKFILLVSLPLILTFLFFSLFRETLPHWTGPAYTTLIVFLSIIMSSKVIRHPRIILIASTLLILFLGIAVAQVKTGFINIDRSEHKRMEDYGSDDPTLDMYGWEQLNQKFRAYAEKDTIKNIVSFRWFPAANIEYYICRNSDFRLTAIGGIDKIHKYLWINNIRGGLKRGESAYFLNFSRDYRDVKELYGDKFEKLVMSDTITIERNKKPAYFVFITKLYGYK